MAKINLIEQLYYNSPIFMQHVMTSIKGYEFCHVRLNYKIVEKYLRLLLTSEKWNPDEYSEYQLAQLHRTLKTAFKHVPFYRDFQKKTGFKINDIKSPEDIKLLPILEKSQVRGNEHLFLHESVELSKCVKGFTSGTTGTPINLFETQESFSKRGAFVARLRLWAGINNPLSPKRAQFTGRNIIPPQQSKNKHIYWRWNIPGNALLFSTTHISKKTVPYYARAMRDFKPELIDGYPSALLVIARISKDLNIRLPKPKAIIVSAETLLPNHRQELEEAFDCKVFDQYAASEPSCFWCNCEHGSMHINPEYGISEIVDKKGDDVQEGNAGDVLVTSFLNPVMFLIRYRLGDTAVKGQSSLCSCGRFMPRIEKIEGRLDDILFVPERGYVGRLDPVFKGLSNIIEAQIIQEELNKIQVLLVPDSDYSDATAFQLQNNLRLKLGNSAKITCSLVDQIPRGPNGKFISVLSKVKNLYPNNI